MPRPSPGKAARNERRKLLATWLNNSAGATITVGILAPVAGILYGFSAIGPDRSGWVLTISGLARLIGGGSILYLIARSIVGGIEE